MKVLFAIRGLPALLGWTFALFAFAFGLWGAADQFTNETTAAHHYWGDATAGLVTATSSYNGDITTARVEYTSPRTATHQDVTRIMAVIAQPGTRPLIWESVDGEVFVQGAATGNRYTPWNIDPWPSQLTIYLIWLVIACVIALALFVTGASIGYLICLRGKASSS